MPRSLGFVALTIVVDCKWDVRRDDVVEADLAVLRWAVGVQCFHAYNAIEKTTFGDRCLVPTLDKHRGELIHVIHTHVHCGPVGGENGDVLRHCEQKYFRDNGKTETQWRDESTMEYYTTRSLKHICFYSLYSLSDVSTKENICPLKIWCLQDILLVWFLAIGAIRTLSTIVGLDSEAVLPLALAVQRLFGANKALAGGAVQHYGLKLSRTRTTWTVVYSEPTDLT